MQDSRDWQEDSAPPPPSHNGFRRRRVSDDSERSTPSINPPPAPPGAALPALPPPPQEEEHLEHPSREQKAFVVIKENVVARSLDEALQALNDQTCVELEFSHHVALSDQQVDTLQK